jgi:hypothetical protein
MMASEENPQSDPQSDPAQSSKDESPETNTFVRQMTNQLQAWLKDSNPDVHSKVESAIESAAQLADQGLTGAKTAVDMLAEFAGDLTGVESFRIIPKADMSCEVDIRCKQEQDIVVKQQLAPFIELYSLHLGRRINFVALINKTDKGLQLDINDGMGLKILAPLIGLQTVEVRGSGLLTRDDSGQLALVISTKVPGLDNPVTVSVPMKHLFRDVHTHIKKKFSNER